MADATATLQSGQALFEQAKDKLIVALDVETVAGARTLVALLGDDAVFYKIGMELAYAPGGLDFARELKAAGRKVFLDLKLHDIGVTVERATRQVARLGADFLTVHAFPQTMAGARLGAEGSGLKLLAVTVMTSYDDADLREAGYALGVSDLVARRAFQAREAGVAGLVLSPLELAAIRALVGPDMLLVTPGVRPAGASAGDQKRVATPRDAMLAGADYLVVGRPITKAADPRRAAREVIAEIAEASRAADTV
jgi:orotidine-5'-phosphate decarboxylase